MYAAGDDVSLAIWYTMYAMFKTSASARLYTEYFSAWRSTARSPYIRKVNQFSKMESITQHSMI